MLCYRCGSHVQDGSESCPTCGQKFALGLKPGPIAGFGTGTRRHRIAIEGAPYKSGDVIAGRFEVKDNVGAGPIGWVYKALDLEIDVDVAVKVVSPRFLQTPEERKLLAREIRQARKLVHPNIVRVYEDGEDAQKPFFTMQHLEGLTLRKIISLRQQKAQLFTLKETEPIVAQIAAALDHAHQIGAHGDVKPENIIVLPDLLKLTDFALATALPRAPFMAAQKAGGVHRYLAPEFLHGEKIDTRADVYSLGVILGEMLGAGPYDPASFDLLARNRDLPAAVDAVFRRATAQKPSSRFATAGELAAALAEALTAKAGAAAAPVSAVEEVTEDEVLEEEPEAPEEAATPPGGTPEPEPELAPAPSLRREPPPVEARAEGKIAGAAVGGAAAEVKPTVHTETTRPRAEAPTRRARVEEIAPALEREAALRAPEVKKKEPSRPPAPAPAPAKEAPKPAAPAPVPAAAAKPGAKAPSSAPVAIAIGILIIGIAGYFAWAYVDKYMPGLLGKGDNAFASAEPAPAEPSPVPPPSAPAGNTLVEPPPPMPPSLPLPPPAPGAPTATIGPAPGATVVRTAATEPARIERPVDTRRGEEESARLRALEEQRRADQEAARKADEERKRLEAEATARRAEEARLAEERKKQEALKAAEEEAARKRAAEEEAAKKKAEEEAARLAAEEEAKKKAAEEASKTEAEKEAAKRVAALSTAIDPCLPGMRYIGAGPFRIGSAPDDPMRNFGEKNLNDVDVGAFCVDVYEYPNKLRVKPTGNIAWTDAKKSCERQGKRLCSEEEWEKACKGPANARFPYAEEYDAEACNTEDADGNDRAVAAAGAFARCKSGYGLFDMAGNVAEWVATPYQSGADEKTIKGGGANRPDWDTRCATRGHKLPGAKNGFIGFRCCMDPKR